jgi:hypothetical protein
MPLAILDPRTLEIDDAIETDQVGPQYSGETCYIRYNPDQRWYWLRNQTCDEVAIFTCFDSHSSTPYSRGKLGCSCSSVARLLTVSHSLSTRFFQRRDCSARLSEARKRGVAMHCLEQGQVGHLEAAYFSGVFAVRPLDTCCQRTTLFE